MSIYTSDDLYRCFGAALIKRYLINALDIAFDNLFGNGMQMNRTETPYWHNQPLLEQCNIGNTIGKVSSPFLAIMTFSVF